jgi:hypothetical protein
MLPAFTGSALNIVILLEETASIHHQRVDNYNLDMYGDIQASEP